MQGANRGCIFIGRSLQFGPSGSDKGAYNLITLVGRQWKGGSFATGDVTNFTEATVNPVAPTSAMSTVPDGSQLVPITGGVTAECIFYGNKTPAASKPCSQTSGITSVDSVTFMTTFNGTDSQGQLESGIAHVDLVVSASTTTMNRSLAAAANSLKSYNDSTTVVNPPSGVFICLQSNGSNQMALINIGGENSRFSSATKILTGKCT